MLNFLGFRNSKTVTPSQVAATSMRESLNEIIPSTGGGSSILKLLGFETLKR